MRRDASENRERVLQAAEEVFADRGPAATLEDVAAAAGVGPATLYRRFANKDALVREVLTRFFRRLIEVAEAAAQEPPEVGLDEFLRTVGVELASKGGLSAPIWGELAPGPLVERLRGLSTELLVRAQAVGAVRADVTPDDVTVAVWALRGVVHAELADPDLLKHRRPRRTLGRSGAGARSSRASPRRTARTWRPAGR